MADYAYYTGKYHGNSMLEPDFSRLVVRAASQLAYYKRIYTVTGDADAENMAVCAMADTLYYYEMVANGGITTSSSVGSVSSSMQAIDVSEKAQSVSLYKAAKLYLTIYRGCD